MKNLLDNEYHPVIENYVLNYVDESLDSVEKVTFEEVLVHDDALRELTFAAKEGKKLMDEFREIKANKDFIERLMASISEEK